MKKLVILSLIFSLNALAQVGSSLLLKDNKESIDLSSRLIKQKTYNLNNPYKVQLFGSWKAARVEDKKTNDWVELVLDDKFKQALIKYPELERSVKNNFKPILESTHAYLQWKLGHNHSFLNQWIHLSANENFLNTELGMALDHVIGKTATNWILINGLILTNEQKELLTKIENSQSLMNFALQAWKNQRKGEESLKWVNKLENNDPLRIQLIYTAITDYARKGKLALSGQLIKKAIEPYIEKSNDEEEISHYYLTLGRLLYQARAYEASNVYYSLIPQTSKYFIQSIVESSWSHIQAGQIAKAKGELATLNLEMFKDRFIPDVFLTNAIVHLKTCQFEEVQADLNSFVITNKDWAKKISLSLKSEKPKMISWNVYTNAIKKHKRTSDQEIKNLRKLFISQDSAYLKNTIAQLSYSQKNVDAYEINQAKQQWQNRLNILEDSIYRMKFVRIEFLSQMRNLAHNIPLSNTDKVSTYNAAPSRNNEMSFPNDGDLWGDDLFNMRAAVKNLCLKGLRNE